MESLGKAIKTFVDSQLVPLGVTAAVAAVVIIGFAFIGGTQKLKEWAKSHIYTTVGGLVLIYLASNIVTSFLTSLGVNVTQF